MSGITLISLVVTIIVILILAGITISTIFGDNGIIQKAQELKNEQDKAQENEKNAINDLATQLNESIIDRVNAEEEALKNIYVFLYDDGTLAFSNYETPAQIEGKTVLKEYGNIKGQVYTYKWVNNEIETNAPWFEDRSTITKVNFLDEIYPTNTACWFGNCNQLTQIENIENLNTKDVTDMHYMFAYCTNLTSLNLSNFDTRNVTDMCDMFYYCINITTIDISSFDTSNVSNMSGMFAGCKTLITLDISNFNTSKNTTMVYMFSYMNAVTEINGLENFDTSNVTNMYHMFYQCYNLVSLNLNNFNTSKVTDMGEMFYHCDSLATLKVDNFDTSNVTNMSSMFRICPSLTSLDLSSFNTSKVTDMYAMFNGDINLKTIYVGLKWTTENVTNTEAMFASCGTNTVTVK